MFHSALYSRCRPTKQNNCTVCYKTGTTSSLEVGEIYCFVSIKSLDEQTLIVAIITPFDTTHFNFTSSQVVNSYLEPRIILIHNPAVRREEYVDIRELSKCIPIHLQGQWVVCTFANSLHGIDLFFSMCNTTVVNIDHDLFYVYMNKTQKHISTSTIKLIMQTLT